MGYSDGLGGADGAQPDPARRRGTGGGNQVVTSKLDGSDQDCVTCGQPGPNQVAQYRPQGDVILFHSWREKNAFKVGSPGFGGIGSEVYVTNADGSGHPVNLTQANPETDKGDPTGAGEH